MGLKNLFGWNQKEKAQELYKQLLISYPSSIYTSDSRTRYRILRGDKPDTEENKTPNELEAAPSF